MALLAAVNRGTYIDKLFITPIEYGIKVLKTCFANKRLTWSEYDKVKNILTIALCQQNISLILMLDALI